MLLYKIDMLLNFYAPFKRINKYKLKLKSKSWINLGLQKSVSVKNKLFTNFNNKKDSMLKEEFHPNYKQYRNYLSTLMKKSKQAYYGKYSGINQNNIKNTQKGIKSFIYLKTAAFSVPILLSINNKDTITKHYDIANSFNNYFTSIAETTKKHKILVLKYFCNLLIKKKQLTSYPLSTLINKASGTNSIPYRILFLLKKQLPDLFNLSFKK